MKNVLLQKNVCNAAAVVGNSDWLTWRLHRLTLIIRVCDSRCRHHSLQRRLLHCWKRGKQTSGSVLQMKHRLANQPNARLKHCLANKQISWPNISRLVIFCCWRRGSFQLPKNQFWCGMPLLNWTQNGFKTIYIHIYILLGYLSSCMSITEWC